MKVSTYIALTIVTLAEATIGVFVKLVGEGVPIWSLNFYRVLFAALFLAVSMPFFNRDFWKFPRHDIKDTVIIGVLIAMQISIFNVAMTLAPIANVVIFWSISPVFAFIFSYLFLGERSTLSQIGIFVLAMIGVVVAEPLSGGHIAGNLVALGSGLVYAALVTYMRNEGKTEQNSDIFWSLIIATLILLPSIFFFGPGEVMAVSHSMPNLVWIALLGMVSTGMAYLFITVAIKDINANIYSLVDTVVSPVVAAILGVLVFGEIPAPHTIYGGIILIISGFLLTREMENKKIQSPT
ncbi:MAG: DMT family transporter [Candidatus Paceibacteria bacterium]